MPKDRYKVEKVMNEFKGDKLKSSSGAPVTDRKQAVAIALSEQRRQDSATQNRDRRLKDKPL